jgi:hypothetical protein
LQTGVDVGLSNRQGIGIVVFVEPTDLAPEEQIIELQREYGGTRVGSVSAVRVDREPGLSVELRVYRDDHTAVDRAIAVQHDGRSELIVLLAKSDTYESGLGALNEVVNTLRWVQYSTAGQTVWLFEQLQRSGRYLAACALLLPAARAQVENVVPSILVPQGIPRIAALRVINQSVKKSSGVPARSARCAATLNIFDLVGARQLLTLAIARAVAHRQLTARRIHGHWAIATLQLPVVDTKH